MKLEVLISTMNRTNKDFLKRIFENIKNHEFKTTVVNQCTNINIDEANKNVAEFINSSDLGLSKSRNLAIKNASSDILIIADDDVVYLKDMPQKVISAFEKYPDADIITFQIETPDGKKFKNYSEKERLHTYRSLMQTSSIEIALRRESLIKNNLKYDEQFGLGSKFPTGEEIIFLTDAFKKKLNIYYIPEPIVVHPEEHSAQDFSNEELVKAKGAMFFRMFGRKAYLISLLFVLKKTPKTNVSLYQFLKWIFMGIKKLK